MVRIGAAAIVVIAASMVLTGCSLAGEPIVQPTAPELAALNATVRDLQWQGLRFSPNAPRPTVELEEYTDPDDTTEVYRTCMREAGHEDWTEINFNALGDAPAAERLDLYVCISRFPLHPSYYGLYSEGQLDAIYDYYQESLVPCMQASGIDVQGVPTRRVRQQSSRPWQHVEPLQLRLRAFRFRLDGDLPRVQRPVVSDRNAAGVSREYQGAWGSLVDYMQTH